MRFDGTPKRSGVTRLITKSSSPSQPSPIA
jgi:hypothetical protein